MKNINEEFPKIIEDAFGLYNLGMYDEALIELEKLIDTERDILKYGAFLIKGRCRQGQGHLDDAESQYQKALKSTNISIKSYAWFYLALVQVDKGNNKDAIDYCKKSLRLNLLNDDVYSCLSDLYLLEGKHEISERFIRKALALDENNAQYWADLGNVLVRAGKINEGLQYLKRATEIEPEDIHLRLKYSLALLDHHEYGMGEEQLKKFLDISPGNIDAYFVYGTYLMDKKKDYNQAALYFNKIIESDKTNYMVYRQLGLCYLWCGRRNEAKECLKRAVELGDVETEKTLISRINHVISSE